MGVDGFHRDGFRSICSTFDHCDALVAVIGLIGLARTVLGTALPILPTGWIEIEFVYKGNSNSSV